MKKCIFCGRTETEFDKNNCWTEEHIIPEVLGNNTLKLYNVCKNCNSGLGTYVDKYFVNNMIFKMQRQLLGLKGKKGRVPNAFKEGIDKEGRLIRVDEKFHPTLVPDIKHEGNNIKIVAPSKEEAKTMIQKKFSRMNMPQDEIQKALDKVEMAESRFYQPVINFNFSVDYNRFFLEALKIAYEYIIYNIGDDYLKDSRAKEIQQILKSAIDGKMKKECRNVSGVNFLDERIAEKIKPAENLNYHLLMVHPDAGNNLVAQIILFMSPGLSFTVLLSEDATKFSNSSFSKIIEVMTKSNERDDE